MKKRKNISNRVLYTFIVLGVLAITATIVYAAAPNPGHTGAEIESLDWSKLTSVPSGLSDGDQVGYTSGSSPTFNKITASDISSTRIVGGSITANNIKLDYTSQYTDASCETLCNSVGGVSASRRCLSAWQDYSPVGCGDTAIGSKLRSCLCVSVVS